MSRSQRDTSGKTLRDLILRSLNVVLVDSLPKTYSTHSVLVDRQLCAGLIARDLVQEGFQSFVVVDSESGTHVDSVRSAISRLSPEAKVTSMSADAVAQFTGSQRTAFICSDMNLASQALQTLRRNGVGVPAQVAVVGIGIEGGGDGYHPCSGYVVSAEQVAESVRQFIADGQSHRPMPLWLVGTFVDHGTMKAKASTRLESATH